MTTLHILNSGIGSQLQSCLRVLSDGDGILLCGEAVQALRTGSQAAQLLMTQNNYRLYALQEDLEARAIDASQFVLTVVDYPAFVALTVEYARVNSWI